MAKRKAWARGPSKHNESWQPLEEHLEAVAGLAARYGYPLGLSEFLRRVGRNHDLLKYVVKWQRYLALNVLKKWDGQKIEHAIQAARYLQGQGLPIKVESCRLLALACFLISRHHTYLDRTRHNTAMSKEDPELDRDVQELFELFGPPQRFDDLDLPAWMSDADALALGYRMAFSCLIDADWENSEAHKDPEAAAIRRRPLRPISALEDAMKCHMTELMAKSPDTRLNRIRREVYEEVMNKANLPQGFYSLSAPGGVGKTFLAMTWGLTHAREHGLDRVFHISPYTSLIDQVCRTLRPILKDDLTEHQHRHTPTAYESTAIEDWFTRVIATTDLQFYETLHAFTAWLLRKLHRVMNSVVILDEAHLIPVDLLAPTLMALRVLVKYFGVTVVISTSTQPRWDRLVHHREWDAHPLPPITELVDNPTRRDLEVRRARIEIIEEPMPWSETGERLDREHQSLAIVNLTRHACELYDRVKSPHKFLISGRKPDRARQDTLAEVKCRLKNNLPCILIATQVMETGQDIGFPSVYRAMTHLLAILQALSRCNREWLIKEGRFYLFTPTDHSVPPGTYETICNVTDRIWNRIKDDLRDPAALELFLREYYTSLNHDRPSRDNPRDSIVDLEQHLRFPEAAKTYRWIKDRSVNLLVANLPGHTDEIESILSTVKKKNPTREQWRALRPFFATVYQSFVDQAQVEGKVDEVCGIPAWTGNYDEERGIYLRKPDGSYL